MATQTTTTKIGWNKTTIGEVYKFTSKPRSLKLPDTVDFIPMEAISARNEEINKHLIKKVTKVSSGTYVENEDLVLAKITPCFENGKQGIISIDFPFAYATTEVIPIQEIKGVSDKWFLAYWLRQHEIRSVLTGKMEGTTGRQRLSKTVLANTEILLPPLSEQKIIAQALMSVKNAMMEQEKLIMKLKELKLGAMRYLFTHGAKGEKTKMTENGEVPESWEVAKLGSICKFEYGKNLPEKKRVLGDIPVYGSNGIVGYHNEAIVNLPGIIIGRKGSAGLVHYSRTAFCPIDTTFYITKDETNLDVRYLFYLLQKLDLRRLRADVGVPGVNREMAYMEIIAYPKDMNRQMEIAKTLDLIEDKIQITQEKLLTYQDLFKTLLHELMSGKRGIKNI